MGRGFGRGAKSVAIVTHSQLKKAKKLPKGIRGNRKSRRRFFKSANDEQTQLEESMGMQNKNDSEKKEGGKNRSEDEGGQQKRKTLAQEVAGIQFQHVIHGKRQKGFKQLRKQILSSVKDIRRRYAQKQRTRAERQQEVLAAKHELEQEKHLKKGHSGHMRRQAKEQAAGEAAETQTKSAKGRTPQKRQRSE